MSDNDLKEMQKTLDEMDKKVADFQAENNNSLDADDFDFSVFNSKLILTILGVVIVLAVSIFFYIKSGGQKMQIKAPPGDEVIYPENGPPILKSFYDKK